MSLVWIDSIIINRVLGTESFAAVLICGQLVNLLILLLGVIGAGTSVVVSHQIGAREMREAADTAGQSIGAGVLVSLALGLLVWAITPVLLRAFGATGGVLDQATTFMRVMAVFTPAMGMMAVLGSVIRATGNTRGPMLITLIVNALNGILNYLLVLGVPPLSLGPLNLPALGGGLGLFGSALGTSLARCFGASLLAALLVRHSDLPIRVGYTVRLRAKTVWRIARLGIPAALEWISYDASQVVITMIIAPLGMEVVAARGLAFKAELLTILPSLGLSAAAAIAVGQLMGAGERNGAVALARRALVGGACLSLALASLLFLFPRLPVLVFTSDPTVVELAATALRIMAVYTAAQSVNIICGGIFRGAGNPQWPTFLTTVGVWLVAVPLSVAAVRYGYGLPGVFAAMAIDEAIRGAINVWYFTTPRWRCRKV